MSFSKTQKNMLGGSKFCNKVATTVMSDGWCSLPERLGLLGMLSVNKKNALRPLRPDPLIYRGVETWVICSANHITYPSTQNSQQVYSLSGRPILGTAISKLSHTLSSLWWPVVHVFLSFTYFISPRLAPMGEGWRP